MKKIICFVLGIAGFMQVVVAQQRIVSLNGAISEILCALGQESQVVGVDITSNYPA